MYGIENNVVVFKANKKYFQKELMQEVCDLQWLNEVLEFDT